MKASHLSKILIFCLVLGLLFAVPAQAANYSSWFKSSYLELETLELIPAEFKDADLTQEISRSEMCRIAVPALEKILNDEITPARTDYFTDTDDVTILKAYELGIVSGYDDGSFQPDKGLSRQEFFIVLVNFCKAASMQPNAQNTSISKFADAGEVSYWAKSAAEICVKYGYVNGSAENGKTYLHPKTVLSRQEAMAMFLRCYKGLNEYYYYVKNAKVVALAGSGSISPVGDTTVTETAGTMYVNADTLNVRSLPSKDGGILGKLIRNAQVSVTGFCANGWFRINYQGKAGYVAGEYLSSSAGAAGGTAPAITVAGEGAVALANYALKFVGTPYVYGGKSPSGFDCSGLVYYVFTNNGYKMNRVANDQMKQGVSVASGNLLAGDLVFFGYGGYADHVGIYIGNGNFVHASNPRGGVKVSAMSETYYAKKYLGARRIVTN